MILRPGGGGAAAGMSGLSTGAGEQSGLEVFDDDLSLDWLVSHGGDAWEAWDCIERVGPFCFVYTLALMNRLLLAKRVSPVQGQSSGYGRSVVTSYRAH